MFALTDQPIEPATWRAKLSAAETGASVIFEGRVRNHHGGRPVKRLEYEALGELAQHEGEEILAEAERLYPGSRVHCVHRTGRLEIGDIAVWIGVESPHRPAAFAACRHVIEELKRRLPIWKKEHFVDADPEWVNCPTENREPAIGDYHARQMMLPEVGTAGQGRLAGARVLVVGAGGLGCPAALYLAGAGIGHLTIVDDGLIERSNLSRQILFTEAELGAPKAIAAAARLRRHNAAIEVSAHEVALSPKNARALVAGQDVVLDCTDNFATRFLVHDICAALNVPLVQAAAHRFEGTLDVFQRGRGGCLHCHWPGISANDLESVERCDGAPVFSPIVGVLGVMQAAEALKLILGLTGDATQQTRLVDLRDGTTRFIERPARPGCPACGNLSALASTPGDETSVFVDARNEGVAADSSIRVRLVLDGEVASAREGIVDVPECDLARIRELAADKPVVLTCRHGVRSAALARLLRAEGLRNVYVEAPTGSER
ncbi:MAG TPA: ThiF family adenylyltransferase [Candidatus Didemnitutus sp.]|nr:ThiF family adenylyltransferase [Candidatus Didemnitutus sp.]